MRTVLFAVVALSSAACTLDMSEPNTSSSSQDVDTWNRLAANRLAANRLAANRLAANRLAANSLSSTKLTALNDTADILQSISGRDVYRYIVSCALAEGVTIGKTSITNYCTETATNTDPPTAPVETCYTTPQPWPAGDDFCTVHGDDPTVADCEYPGSVGLASNWADKKLDNAGQGWVSACLFARSNAYDTAAEISMRGRNSALTITSTEAELYTLQEGGFYGNVFTGANNPIEWYACTGRDQATQEIGGLVLRDCAEEDPNNPGFTVCGFTYAGNCGDYSNTNAPRACSATDAAGNYSICYEDDRAGHWGGLNRYRQIITTYVSASD
jgi:hypothetical protein